MKHVLNDNIEHQCIRISFNIMLYIFFCILVKLKLLVVVYLK